MRFQGTNGFVHWLELSRERYAYSMIIPSIVILFVALLAPLLYSLVISFFDWPLMEPRRNYVGIRNYLELLASEQVRRSLMTTMRFVLYSVFFEMILGIGIAVILNQQFRWRNVVRLAILLPMMASPAVVALGWRMILHADRGVLNYLVSLIGIDRQVWLGPRWAFTAVVLVDVWRSTPFVILVILAGLQAIPDELVDAAHVDGATAWQTFTLRVDRRGSSPDSWPDGDVDDPDEQVEYGWDTGEGMLRRSGQPMLSGCEVNPWGVPFLSLEREGRHALARVVLRVSEQEDARSMAVAVCVRNPLQ